MSLNVQRSDLITFLRNNYFEKLDPVGVRRIKRCIENGLRMVSKEHNWAFLLDTYVFNTTDVYSTGTLTIPSAGDTTWDFSGATLPSDIVTAHAFLEINGEETWYEITERTDDDTLETRYAYAGDETAGTAGISYKIVYPVYNLPTNFRKEIYLKDRKGGTNVFPSQAPATWWAHDEFAGTGQPRAYAVVQDHHDANQKQLLLYPCPEDTQSYELCYWRHAGWYSSATPATSTWRMRATSDDDYVDWPEEKLELLYQAILVCLYREVEPQKQMGAFSMYQQMLDDAKNDDGENGGIRTLSDGGAKPYVFPYQIPTS